MIFKERFELSSYSPEFVNSYLIIKLMDRKRTIEYTKDIAKISKDLGKLTDDIENSMKQSQDVLEFMYKSVADSFISGELYDEELGKERPATKEDIDSFPPKVIRDLTQFIQGNLEKKS